MAERQRLLCAKDAIGGCEAIDWKVKGNSGTTWTLQRYDQNLISTGGPSNTVMGPLFSAVKCKPTGSPRQQTQAETLTCLYLQLLDEHQPVAIPRQQHCMLLKVSDKTTAYTAYLDSITITDGMTPMSQLQTLLHDSTSTQHSFKLDPDTVPTSQVQSG